VLWWLAGDISGWLHAGTLARTGRCAGVIAAGIAVYFGLLLILGARPKDFAARA
jgi:hypothetical protein